MGVDSVRFGTSRNQNWFTEFVGFVLIVVGFAANLCGIMSLLQCAKQLTIDPAVEIQTLLNRSIIDVAARHMVAANGR